MAYILFQLFCPASLPSSTQNPQMKSKSTGSDIKNSMDSFTFKVQQIHCVLAWFIKNTCNGATRRKLMNNCVGNLLSTTWKIIIKRIKLFSIHFVCASILFSLIDFETFSGFRVFYFLNHIEWLWFFYYLLYIFDWPLWESIFFLLYYFQNLCYALLITNCRNFKRFLGFFCQIVILIFMHNKVFNCWF